MKLFEVIAPALPATKSARNWIQKKIQTKSIDWILSTFESGIDRLPNVNRPKDVLSFLFALNTLLDCYIWFFSNDFIDADVLLLGSGMGAKSTSKLINSLRFYMDHSTEFEYQLEDGPLSLALIGTNASLIDRQRLRINRLRLRLYEFVSILIEKLALTDSELFSSIFDSFFDRSFFQLLFQSILYPLRWKINLDQTTIEKQHLPLLTLLCKRLQTQLKSDELNQMCDVLRILLASEFNLLTLVDFSDYSLFKIKIQIKSKSKFKELN
jgi:hypothetical protein